MSGACTAGQSSATIKGNTTVKQDNAAGATGTAAQYVEQERNPDGMATLPDFSDTLLQAARKRMAGDYLAKSSRRQSLANNPGGGAPVGYSLLGS